MGQTNHDYIRTQNVLNDIAQERQNQNAKWGQQSHPLGNDQKNDLTFAGLAREACNDAAEKDELTWRHILMEEVAEVWAETELDKLRLELIQVAAVAVAIVEDLDEQYGLGRKKLNS